LTLRRGLVSIPLKLGGLVAGDEAIARQCRNERRAMKNPERRGDLEEIFEILVTSYGQKGGAIPTEGDLCWRPATDVYETVDEFVVQLDLAGMDPAQIEVICDAETLVVRGVRPDRMGPSKRHFHKMEINVGPFVRRIPIIAPVDPTTAEARYHSGFLTVIFRKGGRREAQRRQIMVNL
jgi:HSP20 family protein